MTLYVVKNTQNADYVFQDSSNISHTLIPGGSGTFDLNGSWFAQISGNLGAANVVPVGSSEYRYAVLGFAAVATPTDVVVMQGSATQVVRIKRITVGGAATAQGNMPVQIVRRSTVGTIGSAVLTAVVPAKHDTNDAAATGVISTVGTANYGVLGTSAGIVAVGRVSMPALTTGAAGSAGTLEFNFEEDPSGNGPLVLRGTTDFICINMNGTAIPSGGVLDIIIETYEAAV